MARLGEKWTMLVIAALQNGPVRFGQLHRTIEGVSQKMLTQTLRNLEQDGLVIRRTVSDVPLRVEYELSDLGLSVLPIVQAIKAWAEDHLQEIEAMHRRNA
ncbi:MAG: helix-turn-helix domain-containing protein [Planctomycetota bacterium]